VDINDLTKLAERFIPQIVKPLAQIADNTDRIATRLTNPEQIEANRRNLEAISSKSEKAVNHQNTTKGLDDFLNSVTLGEINNTFLPKGDSGNSKGGPQNFDETLLTMSIKDILAKERKDIVIKRSDKDMCLGEPGLRNLLVKIVQYYCNQQKDLNTKGLEAENLTKLLLNSTLVKSFKLNNHGENMIRNGIKNMQSDK
jgi:hypothetical protein